MARIARLPHFAGVILACGCLIGMLGFGPRSGMGFLLTPMSSAHSWGRDVFALALAIQMLLWGAAQPFAGAIADRFGAALVLSVGAVLYALGLAASPLPSMSASIFRAREAGTRAFMMRFNWPGTILERFLSKALRPSDTHCSTLIGFIGMVFGSRPNFSSTAVFVNPAASTVT